MYPWQALVEDEVARPFPHLQSYSEPQAPPNSLNPAS